MKTWFFRSTPALVLAVLIGGCEVPPSASLTETDLVSTADFSELLTEELSLTSAQQDAVESEVRRHNGPDVNPGGLWFLAARLHQALEDRQKERLFQLAERLKWGHVHKLVGVYAPCIMHGPHDAPRPVRFGIVADLLTDDQRSAAETIRQTYHERLAELREKATSGEVTREAFAAETQAVHDAMAKELLALLTPEQLATLEERIAAGGGDAEAHAANGRRAMIAALGLVDRQVEALDPLHRRLCGAFQDILDQVHAGELTRDEARSRMVRLVDAKMKALDAILDDEQFESARIHDVLLMINARRYINHITGGGSSHDGDRTGSPAERPGSDTGG